MSDDVFGRINEDGNVNVLYAECGTAVTRLNESVWPVGSEFGARYDHPGGIVLTLDDARKIGLTIEDEGGARWVTT